MQFKAKEYNAEKHDRFHALTVKQPYADDLVTHAYTRAGFDYAVKSIEVRSRATKYRGDLLICSSAKPEIPGRESGVTLGFVELFDIKPVKDFTADDWANTRIPEEKRKYITGGYGWLMRNPRRVVEYPITGQLGIYNLIYTKGDIMEYPRHIIVDKAGYDMLKNTANEK